MRFGLTSIFYAIAVIGSATAACSPWGAVPAAAVLAFWIFAFRAKSWKAVLINAALTLSVGLGIFCYLLLQMISPARDEVWGTWCGSHLRLAALAINNYENARRCYPPAIVADENGRAMHSWRILVRPYYCERHLYDAYDFTEPWNGPNNSRLATIPVPSYVCPNQNRASSQTTTSYVAIVGPNTMWPGSGGRKLEDVTDGSSNTLMLVEIPDSDIRWTEPRDLTVEEFVEMYSSDGPSRGCCIYHDEGFASYTRGWNAVFADSRAVHFDGGLPRDLLTALVTINDGKPVDEALRYSRGRLYWNWGRILAVFCFVLLTVLPAARLRHLVRQQLPKSV